ncbi:MAG: sigma-54-dependent Fis family transcriptional regulator [Alphaproteobacteria bacterium]|nr:MAG: sigma-54-dependent Fis family transcriptional regulator [Alphaproteobacteria bacterium]
MARDVLIVDDESDIRELISGILEDEGYETRVASSSDTALIEIQSRAPTLLILDIWLQGSRLDGLELLETIKRDHPELPVVIISGHGNIEMAVSAIKKGAYDFIEKPFKADRLVLIVQRAIEASRLRQENRELRVRAGDETELVGTSHCISQVRQLIDKVAPTGSRVMITGKPGSGKEVAARLLHARSRREKAPFLAINSATMSPERVEEELFGVEETPDSPRRIGALERAHGGTLYLDEVAEMPLETQSKILRVLIDQTFQRVGGGPIVKVDVRIISSTTRDLRQEISAGRFREDLFHRLNVVPVEIPELAKRREDIPLLVHHFMQRLAETSGLPIMTIGEDTMATLQTYDWPGNVRQLRNIVERLLILAGDSDSKVISADMLPNDVGESTPGLTSEQSEHIISLPLREAREHFEREYLVAQIGRFGGNISRTAAFIGMERSALHRKLKSLGVNPNQRKTEASS